MELDDDLIERARLNLAGWSRLCPPSPERDEWLDHIARRGPYDPFPPPPCCEGERLLQQLPAPN